MSSLPPDPIRLPNEEELWGHYLAGLERNIYSKLAGLFGEEAGAPGTTKSRGVRYDGILIHLLRNETLRSVIIRLVDPSSNSAKQGAASLHDLALAFVWLEVVLQMKGIENDRPESTLASSSLLGDAIPYMRDAWRQITRLYPEKAFGDLTEENVVAAIGSTAIQLQAALDRAVRREGKARRLKQTRETLSVYEAVKVFNFLVLNGLDLRNFEDFLGHHGSGLEGA